MVPWHMQVKYLPKAAASTEEVKKTKKKKKKKHAKKSKLTNNNEDSIGNASFDLPDSNVHTLLPTATDHMLLPNETDHTPSPVEADKTPLPDVAKHIPLPADSIEHSAHDDGSYTVHTPPISVNIHSTVSEQEVTVNHIHPPCDDDHIKKKPSSSNSKEFQTFYRYYHVFCEGELRRLCTNINNVAVKDTWYDHENWCVLFEKRLQH